MTIALVQSASNNNIGGGTTVVIGGAGGTAFGASITAGNTVVGATLFDTGGGQAISSIVDNAGTPNTYTVIDTINDSVNNATLVTFGKANVNGGGTTITVTLTVSSGNQQAVASEYSGTATSSVVDVHGGEVQNGTANPLPGTGTDGITSGSFTTTQANDMIFGVTVASTVFTAASIGTGYTIDINQNSMTSEHKLLAAAGAVAATFTQAANNPRITAMIALQPPGGAPPVTGPAGILGLASSEW